MERRYNPDHNTEIEERDNATRFTGLAAVFYDGSPATEYTLWDTPTRGKAVERILPSAFDRAISEDDCRCLFNHDANYLLGRKSAGTLELVKEQRGLRYRVPFDHTDPDHQKIASKIKRGDLSGSSFAFNVTNEEWRSEGNTEVRYISGVKLYDVGPVVFPAYSGSTVGMRDSQSVKDAEESYAKHQTTIRLEKLKSLL